MVYVILCVRVYISLWAPEVNTGYPQSFSTLVFKIGGIFYWTQNWPAQQGRLARGSRDILVSLISASGICALNLPHLRFSCGCWGSKLRSPCLYDKNFTNWIVFPVPQTSFSSPQDSFESFNCLRGNSLKKIKTRKTVSASSIEKTHPTNSTWQKEDKRVGKGCFCAVKRMLALIERWCVTVKYK